MKVKSSFLPMDASEVTNLHRSPLDIILVTGDAYVDHPAFGTAVIARVLEAAGYRVGILAQPDWHSCAGFTRLGKPRLFFGITSGSVDSIVNNYTPNRKKRSTDRYSPGGRSGRRPNRAVIVYSNRIREAFGKEVPIVLGGVEASLRRLAHYDFWDDGVRRSILLDSRADLLVYGMGERAVKEIAQRLDGGEDVHSLNYVPGTAAVRSDVGPFKGALYLPSYEEVKGDPILFNKAFVLQMGENHAGGKVVVQGSGNQYVVQFPPLPPLLPHELDAFYRLPYARAWHPSYDAQGGVPALEPVRCSISIVRGCFGSCSFCGLAAHQGPWVQSRSPSSVLEEAERISLGRGFRGILSDLGGPTANLYGLCCPFLAKGRKCGKRECLLPEPCPRLDPRGKAFLELLRSVQGMKGIRRAFISSGIRHDLLLSEESDPLLEEICRFHVSGRLKVAPEHSSPRVLRLMNKPPYSRFQEFSERYFRFNRRMGKKQFLVRYFMTAHPGCTLKDMIGLAEIIREEGTSPEQVQDFLPLPMTLSACLYHTGIHPFTGEKVFVEREPRARRIQRAILQFRNPRNARLVAEGLKRARWKGSFGGRGI